jgi:hypothetical protein
MFIATNINGLFPLPFWITILGGAVGVINRYNWYSLMVITPITPVFTAKKKDATSCNWNCAPKYTHIKSNELNINGFKIHVPLIPIIKNAMPIP